MADDTIMSSSLSVALIQDEKLEKTSIDMNVSQWPCERKLIKKVVCTRVVQLMWDRHV
jgi:hypothetical protein